MTTSITDTIHRRHFSAVGPTLREEQRAVIESVLDGHNTLCLMPTGGGKSLCYWVAGKALDGMTVVVSPLTALMDEQAAKLETHGQKVTVLHSGIDVGKQYRLLKQMCRGHLPHFLFVSPERLATDGFVEFVLREIRDQIRLVTVDEAHCISQWGLDFRPYYKAIPPFLQAVFGEPAAWPTILAMTATLSDADCQEIQGDFGIDDSHVLKSQYLLRFTINLDVVKVENDKEKEVLFWEYVQAHAADKMLVYIENRKSGDRSTEGMAERARQQGMAAAHFHSGMTSSDKADVIERFKSNELSAVFATSAFGMGIDIPDIRRVVHFRPPESVEQYYQQIGRGGRDGKPAWAVLYYTDKNIDFRKRTFIDRSFPTEDDLMTADRKLRAGRGRISSFSYFEEEDAQSAFHYLLRSSAFSIVCKGVRSIAVFDGVNGKAPVRFQEYHSATRSGIVVAVSDKTGEPVERIVEDVYGWFASGRVAATRNPAKCLFVEAQGSELAPEQVAAILEDAEAKKQYRYGHLDALVAMLDAFSSSEELHQAIGRHLGIDRYQMGRCHETLSGVMVRSKSEVIIANILWERGIPFRYEERLEAGGTSYAPDFTIDCDGRTYYWEHLGLLGHKDYRTSWEVKRRWYEQYFPGRLITTQESATLSQESEALVLEQFGSIATKARRAAPSGIGGLIGGGESDAVEFKSTLRVNLHTGDKDKRIEHSVLKTIAGFLNANGGTLVVGVDDDGQVVDLSKDGFPNEDKAIVHLVNLLRDGIGTQNLQYVRTRFEDWQAGRILVVTCFPSDQPVYLRQGSEERFYVRTLATTSELKPSEMQAYIASRFS